MGKLATVAECVEVQKCRAAPDDCRAPFVVENQKDWKARFWNLEFWREECADDMWMCYSRAPYLRDDMEGINSFAVETSVSEYVEYVRLVHRADRKCDEENILSLPRVTFSGWSPFCDRMLARFAECWMQLGPPALKDMTPRWIQLFAAAFDVDWHAALARYYQISIRATGTVTRLHTADHGAHVWVNQIEGRTVFYIFSPQQAQNLYAGYATGESPVDIFFPSAKRHPKFAEATAHVAVLYMGQTLVIPSGWWWYSVAIEPSVALSHYFWNMENKVHFTDSLRQNFDFASLGSRAAKQDTEMGLEHIHEQVMADEDSDLDD